MYGKPWIKYGIASAGNGHTKHKACKKGAHKNKKYATPKVCNAATQRNTKLCNVATPKVKTIAYKHERPRSHLQEGYAPRVRVSIG